VRSGFWFLFSSGGVNLPKPEVLLEFYAWITSLLASDPLRSERARIPVSYPASVGCEGRSQAVRRGGSFSVESVAAFAWNGWQASSGISGRLGLEYALFCKIDRVRFD